MKIQKKAMRILTLSKNTLKNIKQVLQKCRHIKQIKACVAFRNINSYIYNTPILSHINYCIMVWGYQGSRIMKIQKKAMRILTLSKYNSHT